MQLEMDLRLRWWWKWQQTDELAVNAARDGFEAALVVAVAADEPGSECSSGGFEAALRGAGSNVMEEIFSGL